jgi:hypothetical protein
MSCRMGEIEIRYEGDRNRRCSRLEEYNSSHMIRSLDITLGKGFQCYLRADKSDIYHHYGMQDCERITLGGRIKKIDGVDKLRFLFAKREMTAEVKKVKREWIKIYVPWIKKHMGELDG